MKRPAVLLLSLSFLFLTADLFAQSASRGVDWTQPAATLTILNEQILDWHASFEELSGQPVTKDSLTEILNLHFQKGPIVVAGMKVLLDWWIHDTSDSEKKSKYLAVSQYFATHFADLGNSWAWEWYRCFAPPLSGRYNFLAEASGVSAVVVGINDKDLLSALSPEEQKSLFQQCRPTVTDYLSYNSYPFVDDAIAKMAFAVQGITLNGRYPKDKSQFNSDFTFAGSLVFLFGMGI